MNIDNVYECSIYVKIKEETIGDIIQRKGMPFVNAQCEGKFVKKALVYIVQNSYSIVYADLKTGDIYKTFDVCDAEIGEMYINLAYGMKPVSEIIEHRRNNMPKRKILEKYNDVEKRGNF